MTNITKKIAKIIAIIIIPLAMIALMNKLIFLFATRQKNQYEENSFYYQWKFGKIHYKVLGSGKPLFLIHSLNTGASSYEFNQIAKNLSKSRMIYMIDLIGYGKSEKPKMTYTAYLFIQLLHDFIKDVVQKPTDIITSGKSSALATMLHQQDSSNLDKLIFINPGDLKDYSKNPSKKDTLLKYILESPFIGTTLYNFYSSKSQIQRRFRKQYFLKQQNYLSKYINAFYESSHLNEAGNKYLFASTQCHYSNVNINNALSQINNSIYLIQGQLRKVSYELITSDYKQINASIESSLINNTKEYPHIEKPKAILEVINLYLG